MKNSIYLYRFYHAVCLRLLRWEVMSLWRCLTSLRSASACLFKGVAVALLWTDKPILCFGLTNCSCASVTSAKSVHWKAWLDPDSPISYACHVPAGPANVSINGPELVVPGSKQSFLCYASCRPSCNFTWRFGSRWLGGHGNEISITAKKLAKERTLTCKAINSVSGLYAMASLNVACRSHGIEVHLFWVSFCSTLSSQPCVHQD